MSKDYADNLAVFRSRFGELAFLLGLDTDEGAARALADAARACSIEPTSSGHPTLRSSGGLLHSRVDPRREAERTLDASRLSPRESVFYGIGLGYAPELYASRNPSASIVVIEPEAPVFISFLAARPLRALLSHPGLAFAVSLPASEAAKIPESLALDDVEPFDSPALCSANPAWWDEFRSLRIRNRQKREINANTLKKFGDLWLRNMCRNLGELRAREGIEAFEGLARDLPVLLVAAGPSLDSLLPRLPDLSRKAIVVAVDTAARACVRAGIEPDFIVLVDPQYWNWRHLDGVVSPRSILIAESAVWPAVFRFPCRRVCLCASLFPLGKFLEGRAGKRAELGAGGSVSTTAWDFARFLGSTRIYVAGLDLGYPGKRTHVAGSVFEERTHNDSTRLTPAETASFRVITQTGLFPAKNHAGGTVLTDKRLLMYAWWFESRIASYPLHRTATITPQGVAIPGIPPAATDEMDSLPDIRPQIDSLLERALSRTAEGGPRDSTSRGIEAREGELSFDRALGELIGEITKIERLAHKGLRLSRDGLRKGTDDARKRGLVAELDAIDRQILSSEAKEVAAMVFTLAAEDESMGTSDPFAASVRLYEALGASARRNIDLLTRWSPSEKND